MQAESHPRHHVDESKTSGTRIADDSETARRDDLIWKWLCLSYVLIVPCNLISSSQSPLSWSLSLCQPNTSIPIPVRKVRVWGEKRLARSRTQRRI